MYKEYLVIFKNEKQNYWFDSEKDLEDYLNNNPHKKIESGKRVKVKEVWDGGWKFV